MKLKKKDTKAKVDLSQDQIRQAYLMTVANQLNQAQWTTQSLSFQPQSSLSFSPQGVNPDMDTKFKVGDKVKIDPDHPHSGNVYCGIYNCVGLSSQLLTRNRVTVFEITSIGQIDPNGVNTRYYVDRRADIWLSDCMLIPAVAPLPKAALKLDSIVMSQEKRDQIMATISQIDNNNTIFTDWGFEDVFEKGTAVTLLFYGVPGTGKTLTAQAIAQELNMELKILGTADIESSEPGAPERTIKTIFEAAKQAIGKNKPQVILFDECDSLLTNRNEAGLIIGAQINTLLGEIEKHTGVIIFTTNRLGKLDPALERRISAKIEFEFPNKEARELIWKRLIPEKAPIYSDVSFRKLSGWKIAGGNIKNCVLNAARIAAYEKSESIKMKHFEQAIDKEIASLDAFAEAYDETPHYTQRGGGYGREVGKIKAEKMEKVAGVEKKSGFELKEEDFLSN